MSISQEINIIEDMEKDDDLLDNDLLEVFIDKVKSVYGYLSESYYNSNDKYDKNKISKLLNLSFINNTKYQLRYIDDINQQIKNLNKKIKKLKTRPLKKEVVKKEKIRIKKEISRWESKKISCVESNKILFKKMLGFYAKNISFYSFEL